MANPAFCGEAGMQPMNLAEFKSRSRNFDFVGVIPPKFSGANAGRTRNGTVRLLFGVDLLRAAGAV